MTEIAMERRCSGCDREIEIVLKRDGTAAKTQFGNARRGTVDRQFVSSITVSAFDDLAKMIASDRFFDLLDEYRDPATADGEWIKTTVTAGPRRKSVVSRDGKAPAGLRALEARIDEMANALSWRERR
ncbi:MAG TPA: hypothetical protein VFV78_07410 [Vicinamibacterales bacterium]|nr:hypothetical protein [Vicinamibacterales bacterium]